MKRSVHFGLNKVDPAKYNGWPGWLSGCWRDAEDMAATFASLGYEATGYFDEQCSLSQLRERFTEAATLTNAGDTFLFSFSGHGGQSLGVLIGTTETLCCYDGQLADTELRDMLAAFKPDANVVIILDSCHSGGAVDRGGRAPRVAPLFVTRSLPVAQGRGDALVMRNGLLVAACQKDETAGDGDANGAFTGSLLKSRTDGVTWRQWFDACTRLMSRNFPSQHPALIELCGSMAAFPVD